MKLIDKDALVAEIKKRIQESLDAGGATRGVYLSERMKEDSYILSFLDTLEVKEVDLEKELIKWHKEHFKKDGTFIGMSGFYLTNNSQMDIAKYFFELGFSVNNPITASDRGMAEEIIINLKRVEQDYCINLTKEMEWLRNKVQKGEKV